MPKPRRPLAPAFHPTEVPARLPMTAKRWGLLAALVVAAVAIAWIDGGEQPLRPIAQPVALPIALPGQPR